MTTLFRETIECCACGKESDHMSVGSTYTSGSADLDTRPPELERSTIEYLIQRCPHCSYCASDLTDCDGISHDLINNDEYNKIISNQAMHEKAREFLAASYLSEAAGNSLKAVWHVISAAWICDDSNEDDLATACRETAITLGLQMLNSSDVIAEQEGASALIIVDLMRRAGKFKEAHSLINENSSNALDDVIKQVFAFEEKLINAEDRQAHLIEEAFA